MLVENKETEYLDASSAEKGASRLFKADTQGRLQFVGRGLPDRPHPQGETLRLYLDGCVRSGRRAHRRTDFKRMGKKQVEERLKGFCCAIVGNRRRWILSSWNMSGPTTGDRESAPIPMRKRMRAPWNFPFRLRSARRSRYPILSARGGSSATQELCPRAWNHRSGSLEENNVCKGEVLAY